jgi:uncharacterized protein YdhG (YjbR/CyaY superfamily)
MSPKKDTQESAKSATAISRKSKGLTDEEIAAMKETLKERKAEARWNKDRGEGEKAALAAIAAMKEPDRSMAKRIHAIIKDNAPDLSARTWYGMPAYANRGGKVVCFFQTGQKFKTRYSTFGFQDAANLDEGTMWPTSFALTKVTSTDEKRIAALVQKAVS